LCGAAEKPETTSENVIPEIVVDILTRKNALILLGLSRKIVQK